MRPALCHVTPPGRAEDRAAEKAVVSGGGRPSARTEERRISGGRRGAEMRAGVTTWTQYIAVHEKFRLADATTMSSCRGTRGIADGVCPHHPLTGAHEASRCVPYGEEDPVCKAQKHHAHGMLDRQIG